MLTCPKIVFRVRDLQSEQLKFTFRYSTVTCDPAELDMRNILSWSTTSPGLIPAVKNILQC